MKLNNVAKIPRMLFVTLFLQDPEAENNRQKTYSGQVYRIQVHFHSLFTSTQYKKRLRIHGVVKNWQIILIYRKTCWSIGSFSPHPKSRLFLPTQTKSMCTRVREAALPRTPLYAAGCWEQSFETRLYWQGPIYPVLDLARMYVLSNWPSGFIKSRLP